MAMIESYVILYVLSNEFRTLYMDYLALAQEVSVSEL
jgi:hypothetical protein